MEKCRNCETEKPRYELKKGWTNSLYCSYECELRHVSAVHESMPGTGRLPRPNWVPHHIGNEIRNRWAEQ